MSPNPQETADLVKFTEESLMEDFIFCAVTTTWRPKFPMLTSFQSSLHRIFLPII